MTVKPTISLTDQAHAFAKSLVEEGKFASLSAVVQHGVMLVKREEEAHLVRLEAIREDLERRATGPSLTLEQVDAEIATWREQRDDEPSREDVA